MHRAILGVFAIALCACGRTPSPSPDRSADLSDSLWQAQCVRLGNGPHEACYGPGWEAQSPRDPKKYDFYEVSVARRDSATTSSELFSRHLLAPEVHPELLTIAPRAVVRYDDTKGEVVFHVSKEPIVYRLQRR
jgi:hypothetical protein